MRIDGKLTKWNDDRGFGFITPVNGGQDIFVHVSAFPRDGVRPRLGEMLSFEIELNREQKKRAKNVLRPLRPQPAPRLRPATVHEARPTSGRLRSRLPMMLMLALAAGVYAFFQQPNRPDAPMTALSSGAAPPAAPAVTGPAEAAWRCDGRVHCSQMTSCAEAKFFLKNCPGVKMDGDSDGTPCEEQWCTDSLAR